MSEHIIKTCATHLVGDQWSESHEDKIQRALMRRFETEGDLVLNNETKFGDILSFKSFIDKLLVSLNQIEAEQDAIIALIQQFVHEQHINFHVPHSWTAVPNFLLERALSSQGKTRVPLVMTDADLFSRHHSLGIGLIPSTALGGTGFIIASTLATLLEPHKYAHWVPLMSDHDIITNFIAGLVQIVEPSRSSHIAGDSTAEITLNDASNITEWKRIKPQVQYALLLLSKITQYLASLKE